MRKITNVVAALVVSLTMSSVASASVMTTGTLNYDTDSNVITDSVSGETYLGWDMVKNLDYDGTVDITTGVGFYSDWHIATQTEAYDFYRAATGSTIVDVIGSQTETSGLDSLADGMRFGDSYISSGDWVGFLSDESSAIGQLVGSGAGLQINDNWTSISYLDTYCCNQSHDVGLLLVGGTAGATSAVPEPSIIALFGLGLVGIGFARRKRQS